MDGMISVFVSCEDGLCAASCREFPAVCGNGDTAGEALGMLGRELDEFFDAADTPEAEAAAHALIDVVSRLETVL